MRFAVAHAAWAAVWLASLPLAADEEEDALAYHFEVDTVSRLFRRQDATGGALVSGGYAVPLYHYALLRVADVDTPWREDAVDAELAAWGNLEIGDVDEIGRFDGDVHVANVRQRFRYTYITMGRQVRAGGAARFARFDGIAVGARAPLGLGADAYGGFTVLPRWSQREGYHLLGSAADTLLRDPTALPEPERHQHWMAGGRLYAERPGFVTGGVSYHEQAEQGGLGHRNGAFDLSLTPMRELAVSGLAIVDIDAQDFADARGSIDTYPTRWLTVSGTYQHLVPALLLSRQSVLSVFSTDAFDEWGLESEVRPLRWLRLRADGFVERFEGGGDLGARAGGSVRFVDDGPISTTAGLAYRRVVETENGYHSIRATLSVRPTPPLTLTGDGYLYAYDEPIQNVSTSVVGIASAAWQVTDPIELVLSGSLARSPYADIDAQILTRLSVALEGGGR